MCLIEGEIVCVFNYVCNHLYFTFYCSERDVGFGGQHDINGTTIIRASPVNSCLRYARKSQVNFYSFISLLILPPNVRAFRRLLFRRLNPKYRSNEFRPFWLATICIQIGADSDVIRVTRENDE